MISYFDNKFIHTVLVSTHDKATGQVLANSPTNVPKSYKHNHYWHTLYSGLLNNQ